ncbi:MAG: response regulator [Defluviitaleaceae bacterium]|nr:response regulator [Defluviitaleaceae bacterium]
MPVQRYSDYPENVTEQKNMNPKIIFVVDDDVTNLTVCRNTLSPVYNVFSFESGSLLLKRLERQIPDLILLDIDMPEMNGYEILGRLKKMQSTRDISVIFLTSKIDAESELEGLSLGAVDYIFKPFSPPLLLKRIELHLLVISQRNELVDFNEHLQEKVDAKTKAVVELQNAILNTMTKLVDCRDDITGGHIVRTQRYMEVLVNEGIEKKYFEDDLLSCEISLLVLSARLHDVGKIAIKDSILLKPCKLTEDEFDEVKKHARFGEDVIAEIQEESTEHKFLEYAKILAGTHHEKWDGSGYPRGLQGTDIPILGRTMAIVDVYDALVSDRPYKRGFSHEESVSIIVDGRGSHFDPMLVDIFLSIADKFKDISECSRQA